MKEKGKELETFNSKVKLQRYRVGLCYLFSSVLPSRGKKIDGDILPGGKDV